MNGLDLFSGIGGITLALAPWVRPVAYCENERYAQAVLLSRMLARDLPDAPIWDDVRTLDACSIPIPVDIVYGGFPCQDISVAGNGTGLAGERSGLYFEVERLVKELTPTFVFLENVPAIRTRGAERVVKGLASLGYDCRWTTLSAAQIGANHKRERWWLLGFRRAPVANADSVRELQSSRVIENIGQRVSYSGAPLPHTDSASLWQQPGGRSGPHGSEEALANAPLERLEGFGEGLSGFGCGQSPKRAMLSNECLFTSEWWLTEPPVGRVAHGIPARVDRLKSLGNSVVPAAAREAFKILTGVRA